ncbi:ParB N-terminal domain-containing protein [Arcicella rigui]|uniref:ParB/Sulfiredoxin domain-containing protein n=1 Tax=Arcicella rigui TaxID=797020 RepID=A0ABU5QE80_9BACT|nr:hypothetical protein [Arcicella rigui]MEA5141146.1 hypothetical protein [Arcicella rigui]
MAKKYMGSLGTATIIKDQSLLNHEAIKQQIYIVDELRDLIPPLQEEEYKQLEKNILAEGCREALMVWETTKNNVDTTLTDTSTVYVLVDGHNRYGICQKHQINFKIHLVSFNNLREVKEYMIDNQLGRRNLIPEQASYLRGIRYNAEKLEKGKYVRDEHKGQNVPYASEVKKESTSLKLAKQYNVSEKTIKRDAEFAEGLNLLDPSLKKDILSGKVKAKKSEIQQLAQISEVPEKSITTLEEVSMILQTNEPKVSKSEDLENHKTVLMSKIQEIALSINSNASQSLCDELIKLSQALKKVL